MASSPDPSMPLTVQLLFLFCLILINAFFAAAETSIVSVNKNKIKILAQGNNPKAILLLDLLDQPNKFMSTIQVAITFLGFLSSATAAIGMSDNLGTFFSKWGILYGNYIAVILVTLILTYVTLVLGQLYPKRIALQHSKEIALFVVKPVFIISKIMTPFVWILTKSVNMVLILTNQKVDLEDEEFSEDEVMSMLEVGQETGVLKEEGKKMINSIFAFDDKLAYEIMTPRTDVFFIDVNDPAEEYMDEFMELRYSRIPVCEDDSDNIIGILHIKDYLIKARESGFDNVDIREILRKPYFVPETKNIDSLFFELQSSKQHIAVLIDEYGGFSGIVTIEDIIEEVMGDIDDEYDEAEEQIEKIDENTYRISGFIDLDDLEEKTGIKLETENSETLGGFLMEMLGEIPDEHEHEERIIEFNNYTFKIESVKDRRIESVKIHVAPEPMFENKFTEEEAK